MAEATEAKTAVAETAIAEAAVAVATVAEADADNSGLSGVGEGEKNDGGELKRERLRVRFLP